MLAIHPRPGSFSDKWIEYCENNSIKFTLVNCYDSDIINQLKDCTGLMWHWSHSDHKAAIFARQLTYALEATGKVVFPNTHTCWHFDDKVGQKYLLEAINAHLVESYVFYEKRDALNWAKHTGYPKVFKLKGGAGAENVEIVNGYNRLKRLVNRAFGKGFKAKNRLNFLKERLWHFKRDRTLKSFLNISKGIARLFLPKEAELKLPVERNYAYFQDFIPNNDHDIRVIVIGKRAFAIKRMVREGDFRASGSGFIVYDQSQIPIECVKLSFAIAEKLNTQCLAYDYIFKEGLPLLVEISYGFKCEGYLPCPGYWDDYLQWHEGSFHPEYFMIEDFLGKTG